MGTSSETPGQREIIRSLPKSVGLRMYFPDGVETAEQKVVFSLWMSGGDQCFCNLMLLTGLEEEELRGAIRDLKQSARVTTKLLPTADGDDLKLTRVLLRD